MNCLFIQSEMEMGMISRASRVSDEEDDEFSSQLDKMMNDAIKVSYQSPLFPMIYSFFRILHSALLTIFEKWKNLKSNNNCSLFQSSQYTSVTSPPSVNSISSALNISSGKVERSSERFHSYHKGTLITHYSTDPSLIVDIVSPSPFPSNPFPLLVSLNSSTVDCCRLSSTARSESRREGKEDSLTI